MRKVRKDFANPPAKLLEPDTLKLIEASLSEKGDHEFKTGVYGHPEVRAVLKVIYNNKCAFCETDITAGATMQVDHYRPKAKVTDNKQTLTGYYWLGYQWSNLLLACSACNNKKRNNFPLAAGATRLDAHPLLNGALDTARCLVTGPDLSGEQPLFINPETATEAELRNHFTFDSTGEIKALTLAARATIDTQKGMNLNRGPLVAARQKVYNTCFKAIMKELDEWDSGRISESQARHGIKRRIFDLIVIDADNAEYAEFARACWLQFKSFFVDKLKAGIWQTTVQTVYDDVIQEARAAGLAV